MVITMSNSADSKNVHNGTNERTVNNVGTVFTNDGFTFIPRTLENKRETLFIETSTHEIVKTSLDHYDTSFIVFEHVFNPVTDNIVSFEKQFINTGEFKAKNSTNKIKSPIDRNTYDKLSTNIQSFYSEIIKKEEVPVIYEYDFIDLVEKAAHIENTVFYSRIDVLRNITRFNFKNNKRAKISIDTARAFNTSKLVVGSIIVEFFENDYNGEMRKVLDKKRNGGHYADRRGKVVPDYPNVIDKLTIKDKDIPYFSAANQDEMNKKMQDYVDFITMTHLLPE